MAIPKRQLFRLFLVLLLSGGIFFGIARHFFDSKRIASAVAEKLRSLYGGHAEVGEARVGLASSSVQNVSFFELSPQGNGPPWIVIENIDAEVELWDLLVGDGIPDHLRLTGAAITLRVDSEGHLSTALPKSERKPGRIPSCSIVNSRIAIHQVGLPEFVLTGVNADISSNGELLALKGSIADKLWGDAAIEASFNQETRDASFSLKMPRTHITQKMLASLPFVPAKTWDQVQLEGDTPVSLVVRIDPAIPGIHSRVELAPEDTSVHVNSIDLHAQHANGTVVIEDKIIMLTDVVGKSADGVMKTNAVLDFRQKPTNMQFAVGVEKVELQKLPSKWKIPPRYQGTLTGTANLKVVVADGKPLTTGKGQGTAKVGGKVPLTLPIKLSADSKGFHFSFNPLPH